MELLAFAIFRNEISNIGTALFSNVQKRDLSRHYFNYKMAPGYGKILIHWDVVLEIGLSTYK